MTYALLPRALEADDVEAGAPAAKLADPVAHGALGDEQQKGALHSAKVLEVAQQGNGLKRLAKTL
jgi:molecular chaperone GrpE (heat shock protein)